MDSLQEERRHLDDVQAQIERQVRHLRSIPNYLNSDSEEPQTADEVAQQAVDIVRAEQIHTLTTAQREPYFGRLDFQAEDRSETLALYIGKRGVENEVTGDQLVVDWRAPVASLFYSFSGKSDDADYESPDGKVAGKVFLKRNIVVRQSELQRVVDSYVKGQDNLGVTDEFLLYRLAENKDNRLRDIVSTIQEEQDRIIRTDRNQAIFIQGVAGSGKTTVALHRLAFLLYQYADKLRTERMVIFAPNAMFVDYISDVLPELGVGGIQQTTFAAWALRVMDQAVKLKDPAERITRFFAVRKDTGLEESLQSAARKGSLRFVERMDRHLRQVEATAVPEGDFNAWEGAVLPEAAIRQWFGEEYSHMPLAERKERVLARVKRWYEIEWRNAVSDEDEDRSAKKKLASQRFRAYAKKWPELTPLQLYREILKGAEPRSLPGKQGTKKARAVSAARDGKRPVVELEDLGPLLYLHLRLRGVDSRYRFDHVVIDEAQDFSPLQLKVLKEWCPSHSFTILGDLAQSIHTDQGITDWQSFFALFDEGQRAFFQLDVSYRSTMEVIEFANAVIAPFGTFALAKPVFRSGEPVVVRQVAEGDRLGCAVKAVCELREKVDTIAVVGRTDEDCALYHAALTKAGIAVHLINAKQQKYSGGISVLPVYMTKGLEFDAVLLVDVNETNYDASPLCAKLLYVGCTRALHTLRVHYSGIISPLLAQG